MRAPIHAAIFVATLAMTGTVLSAQSLPAFRLVTPDGGSVASDVLPTTGQWLLVYVVPGSAPSDRLIQSLGESWSAETASRIVIIVGADVAKAKTYLTDKGTEAMAGATWYADPQSEAWRALGFQGTLGVAGIVGSAIDWKIDGVIDDPSVVAPVTRSWLQKGTR